MGKFDFIAPRIWDGTATDEELSAVGAEDVFAIKSDVEHVRRTFSVRGKPKSVNTIERTVEHVASDETPDRMGDIIRVKGWDLDAFKSNPVLLRYHNSEAPPLGTVPQVKRGKKDDGSPALLTLSQFFADDKQDDEGRLLARLVMDGDLPAVSVGFMPLSTLRPETAEERTKLGLGPWGVVYEGAQLLELSVVTVPANPNALMRKLDALAESGALSKALAAQVMKSCEPSTRTIVPVAKIDDTPTDTAKNDPYLERLDAIDKSLGVLTTTLSAELPTLRALLESVTRGSGAPSAAQGAPQVPEVQPAPDSKSANTEALTGSLQAAFDAIDRAIAARKSKPRGGYTK